MANYINNQVGARPFYMIGNIALTAGSDQFTVSEGANLQIANLWPGDAFGHPNGATLYVKSVEDATHGTLVDPCPTECAGSFRVLFNYQPDGSRINASNRELIQLLSNGVILSIAGLTYTDGDILMATGPGTFKAVKPGESGLGDMSKATYDPSGKSTDAFNQDNMVEGTANKNFTATEKTKLAGLPSSALPVSGGTLTGNLIMDFNYQYPMFTVRFPDGTSDGGGLSLQPATGGKKTEICYLTNGGVRFYAENSGNFCRFSPSTGTNVSGPFSVNNKAVVDTNGKIAVAAINATGTANGNTYLRGDGTWSTPPLGIRGGTSSGDILKSVYDPNGKAADAFNMDNMVEGQDRLILTSAERKAISNAVAKTTIIPVSDGLSGGGILSDLTTISLSPSSRAAIALAKTAVQPADLGTLAKKNEIATSDIAGAASALDNQILSKAGWVNPPSGGGGSASSGSLYNWIINGNFTIDQRVKKGITTASQWGYDRWYGVANGRQQMVESFPGGLCTLTWTGGGTATLGTVSGTSPIVATVAAGNLKVVVPFTSSKISLVQGDASASDPWQERPFAEELRRCMRYYQKSVAYSIDVTTTYTEANMVSVACLFPTKTANTASATIILPVPMKDTTGFYSNYGFAVYADGTKSNMRPSRATSTEQSVTITNATAGKDVIYGFQFLYSIDAEFFS